MVSYDSDGSELSETHSIPTPDATHLKSRIHARTDEKSRYSQYVEQATKAGGERSKETSPMTTHQELSDHLPVNTTDGAKVLQKPSHAESQEVRHITLDTPAADELVEQSPDDVESKITKEATVPNNITVALQELSRKSSDASEHEPGDLTGSDSVQQQENPSNQVEDVKVDTNKELAELKRDRGQAEDQTTGQRLSKRNRVAPPKICPTEFLPPYKPATSEEKADWGGFCEIESDPAVFNNVLRGFGVEGVQIEEVYSLDDDMLSFLPKPVHGLIFLYQYIEAEDVEQQFEECPPHVWFANQVVPNCCATIALLNVVNNIPADALLLSEEFRRLKDFTLPFTPAFRGDQVANCRFIKKAHNAYARKIDMLNADLSLETSWTEGQKKKPRIGARAKSNRKGSKKKQAEQSAFHFVAYMPINGEMWRMDGLDSYPQSLGSIVTGTDNWLAEIAPILTARMAAYSEHGVQFSLLAMVPEVKCQSKFEYIQSLQLLKLVEEKLKVMDSSWRQSSGEYCENNAINNISVVEPTRSYSGEPHQSIRIRVEQCSDTTTLLNLHRETTRQHAELKQYCEEQSTTNDKLQGEDIRALDRQNDYVPFIQKWFSMLADNQELKSLVETHG